MLTYQDYTVFAKYINIQRILIDIYWYIDIPFMKAALVLEAGAGKQEIQRKTYREQEMEGKEVGVGVMII